MQIQKQIQVLNRMQSRGQFESAVFMQKIQELQRELIALQDNDVERQLRTNKTLQRIRTVIKTLEKGPERLDFFSEELFQKMIDKIVITEDRKIIFFLISGFQFEEAAE